MFYLLNFIIPIVLFIPILYLAKHQTKHKKLVALFVIVSLFYLFTLPFLNTANLYPVPFKIVG